LQVIQGAQELTKPDDLSPKTTGLEGKSRLTGLLPILPDAATGPAVGHGCALFFDHPTGKCFVELTPQECQSLAQWLTGHHPEYKPPPGASLN